MRRRVSATVLCAFISVFLCATFSLYSSRNQTYGAQVLYPSPPNIATRLSNLVIQETLNHPTRHVASVQDSNSITSVAILFPDWEVLLIVSSESDNHLLSGDYFTCLYPNNVTSPARFSGILPSTNQSTFKCFLPRRARLMMPFFAPILKRSWDKEFPVPWPSSPKQVLLRSNFLVYESLSTEDDMVVFVKGLNNRQGINRSPHEFNCVFIDEAKNATVKTAVTSSIQEVFRCPHPGLSADPMKIKVSIEILEGNKLVPSVAYYSPRRKIAKEQLKSQLCATTMVYNVGKFLREWVTYYSKIGVEKFILYNNDSDDNLIAIVAELNQEGFDIETLFWIWPKTQEAGFSHAALLANGSCNWMMYVDVDEFIYSPEWENSTHPSHQLLNSLLPSNNEELIGEVSINCNEFGPSNQRSHPAEGVVQGYNCRRRLENRHKSIVLLKAVHYSLLNVIHHFELNEEYRRKHLGMEMAVVNHYKYQAWTEFKAKFRRRVSAYVVDWMKAVNLASKDRTPGLGFQAVEPPGWENMFCEVVDDRLKLITQAWFGTKTETGYRMVWQS